MRLCREFGGAHDGVQANMSMWCDDDPLASVSRLTLTLVNQKLQNASEGHQIVQIDIRCTSDFLNDLKCYLWV